MWSLTIVLLCSPLFVAFITANAVALLTILTNLMIMMSVLISAVRVIWFSMKPMQIDSSSHYLYPWLPIPTSSPIFSPNPSILNFSLPNLKSKLSYLHSTSYIFISTFFVFLTIISNHQHNLNFFFVNLLFYSLVNHSLIWNIKVLLLSPILWSFFHEVFDCITKLMFIVLKRMSLSSGISATIVILVFEKFITAKLFCLNRRFFWRSILIFVKVSLSTLSTSFFKYFHFYSSYLFILPMSHYHHHHHFPTHYCQCWLHYLPWNKNFLYSLIHSEQRVSV